MYNTPMTLRDEMLRIYKDSGTQKRIDQLVAGFAEQIINQIAPPDMLRPTDMPPPPAPPAPPKTPSYQSAYQIVGVSQGDSQELIDAVYRAKAKYLHPDCPTGNTDEFIKLKTAYDTIRRHS